MNFLEKDLEEIIFNSSIVELLNRGLPVPPRLRRQVKVGNYGRLDLIGVDNWREDGRATITIFELKQKKISVSSFLQAVGYAKGVKSFFQKRRPYKTHNKSCLHNPVIKIVLIGSEIDNHSTFIYLPQVISQGYDFILEYYTYEYKLDGIRFKSHNYYSLTNEGF